MLSRDYRDIVGGTLIVTVGLAYSWYAAEHYAIGTFRQMGPGMFPVALGLIFTALGLVVLVPAFFRPGVKQRIRFWTPFFVLLGVAAFALLIQPFGLIPAILAVVIISSFAELRVRLASLVGLCVVLCTLAWLTFDVGLNLPIPLLRWPF